jgi:hypothetical protein
MNDRLKELESQCWEAKPYGPPWFDSKKFANLIVREAIMALYEDDGATHHERLLTEHFGICNHEWVSAKNPVVVNGSICIKCGAIDPREPEELR